MGDNSLVLTSDEPVNTEIVKVSVGEKVLILFSFPESDYETRDITRLKYSIDKATSTLNEWVKSSDDTFFSLMVADDLTVEFQKVSPNE